MKESPQYDAKSCLAGGHRVALLTGGGDKPYALGLTSALVERGIGVEFLGSTQVDSPWLHEHPLVQFRMFRNQAEGAGNLAKAFRVLVYYGRLFAYSICARPRIFHILWNNHFEAFDRTLLTAFYRLCGRKVILTAHNVNKARRDGNDSSWNRLTLGAQYRMASQIFVHTEKMRAELIEDFEVAASKISVIPFGMNNTLPNTNLDGLGARNRLNLAPQAKVLLFFGNIAPYKGLDLLVNAFLRLASVDGELFMVIAGRPKGGQNYWRKMERRIEDSPFADRVIRRIEYVPDEETETYFKAADALVLPYRKIFQSGVLFLGYNFGLPVIVTDVGSLAEDVVEGETGVVSASVDEEGLAQSISRYFESHLYRRLPANRKTIRDYAMQRYSWSTVGEVTEAVYVRLGAGGPEHSSEREHRGIRS